MIEVRDARVAVGARTVLDGVNLTIARGSFTAVLGANGAGKTTLLRTLAGALPLHAGSVLVGGRAPAALHARERARAIAYVQSEEVEIADVNVREAVGIGRYAFHRWWEWSAGAVDGTAVDGALHAVALEGVERRGVRTLSSGERQRVWLALALAQGAPVLVLDEPTNHLDIRAAHEVLAVLHAQARAGKTIVCAMHDVNEAAAYADCVVLLGESRVLAYDAPERALTESLLQRAYGMPMERTVLASGQIRVWPITRTG